MSLRARLLPDPRPFEAFVRLLYRGHAATALANAALILCRAALPVGVLLLTRLLVNGIVSDGAPGRTTPQQLALLVGGIALLTLLDGGCRALAGWLTEVQAEEATERVQEEIHRQSAALDLAYYDEPAFHDSLHRAQHQSLARPRQVVGHLNQLGQTAVSLVGIAGVLAYLNWAIAFLLFAAALPGFWVRVRNSRRLQQSEQRRTAAERRAQYLHWLMTGADPARELRLFGLAELFRERFAALRREIRAERLALARSRAFGEVVAQAASAVVLAASSLWAAWAALHGRITPGDFILYLQAFHRGLSLFQELLTNLGGLYEDSLFLAHLDEFLQLKARVASPERPAALPERLAAGLEVQEVGFRYAGSTADALTGVNLRVCPGEIVALVGENGSGKSTLVQLLCRLYEPSAGRITLDGIDLRAFSPEGLRRRIAVLFQQFTRYQVPAGENLWFGDVAAPPDERRRDAAAAAAGADALLADLPRGYDTLLGNQFNGGRELSAGQWQRVALARALYRDANLLVLDEPTSAMDPSAEAGVFDALRAIASGRMILLITHRASLARLADRIYVMKSGQAVESGSHTELLARDGAYARLFRAQAALEPAGADAGSPPGV